LEAETAKNNKNEVARSLLAKHFPTHTSKATSSSSPVQTGRTPSSDPKKLAMAQKVQAMKTTAVCLDQKLYVQVKLEGNSTVSVLWFRKVNASLHVTHTCHC
jgi:hypothetical protein